ncbi:MAG: penicillin-insensitive murein endopeptidase [Bdellovibrionales bacterium]
MPKVVQLMLICSLLGTVGCAKTDESNSEVSGQRGELVKDLPPADPGKLPEDMPKDSLPQAVGFYASGSLINSYNLPLDGFGFIKVFRTRDRGYVTDLLYWVLTEAAAELKEGYPDSERVQIGDTSDSNGGQLSRHASHQNGLDADLAYYRVNRREMNPEGFGGFDEVFVKTGKITPNFDVVRNYHFIDALVATGQVGRIFTDSVIKEALCRYAAQLPKGAMASRSTETLRRLRPITNHQDHMHVRVKCPSTSPNCQTQEEPPAGSGCPAKGQSLINSYNFHEEE